jgi:hypothetical protein
MDRGDAGKAIAEAHRALRMAWTRASLLRDEGINRCYHALDMVLYLAEGDTRRVWMGRVRPGEPVELPVDGQVNFYPIWVAFFDLRKALDAYLRGEEPPTPEIPSQEELIDIFYPEGRDVGIVGLGDYLRKQQLARERDAGAPKAVPPAAATGLIRKSGPCE